MKSLINLIMLFSLIILAFGPMAMSFAQAPDEALRGTSWQLLSYGTPGAETPVIEGSGVTLVFQEDDVAGGSGGCNGYGSNYSVEGDLLSFSMVVSTLMACMEDGLMQQEQAYLQALEAATAYSLRDGQLIIAYGDAQELVFVPLGSLIGSEWLLQAYGPADAETPVLAGSLISLNFTEDEQISGSAGCNTYGGAYSLSDGLLSFIDVFFTERACMEEGIMAQEASYLAAILSATGYELQGEQLLISYGDADERLRFVRAFDLVGTEWELLSLDEENPALADSGITLSFEEGNRASGHGGCNSFSATYSALGTQLSISPVASTKMACLDEGLSAQESAFFAALEAATRFEVQDGQLIVHYADGQQMRFTALITEAQA